jgi:hypothetical protein
MTVMIEGVTLPGLQINEDWNTGIDSIVEQSDAGSPIVFERERLYKKMDIIGGERWGNLTAEVLRHVQQLASVAGMTYTLTYNGNQSTIRFRNEDAPVIESEPLSGAKQDDAMYHKNIVIKIMEV